MRRLARFLLSLVVILVVLGAGAWLWLGQGTAMAPVPTPDPASFAAEDVALGEKLVALGDCAVCHTAPGGQVNAGGLGLDTPFGTVYSTNITPDRDTGIGAWSLDAFVRSMRHGLDRQGNHLYPVFPYDHFARVTDADLAAIYAYLMSRPAVVQPATPNGLRFPFNLRPLLAGWKILYLKQGVFAADPALSDEENRGAYLVQGLGHCGACHTPRTALGGLDRARPYAGAVAEGWTVPAIGAASAAPVPWSADSYTNYLFDGWDEGHGLAAGPMTAVIDALYDADEDDVYAMAAYLATLSPTPAEQAVKDAIAAAGQHDWADGEQPGGANAPKDAALIHGEAIFAATCAKCHKARVSKEQPISLGLSSVVNADSGADFLRIVTEGIQPPRASRDRAMPAQGQKVSGQDLADLAAFVRWRFTDRPAWSDIPAAPMEAAKTGG